LEYLS